MKKTSKRLFAARILLISLAGCLLLAMALMTAAMLLNLEVGTNYFSRGAILPKLAIFSAILGGLCGVTAILLFPAERLSGYSPLDAGAFSGVPAAIGFAFLGASAAFFSDGVYRILFPVLALLSAVYFLLGGAFAGGRKGLSRFFPVLGVAPVVACILWVAYSYFDLSVEMNAPVKVPVQLALLLAMLCFTEELRFPLGRPMPRLCLILCTLSVSAAALVAVAFPVAFFLKKIPLCYFAGAMVAFGSALTWLMRAAPFLADGSGNAPTAAPDAPVSPDPAETPTENDTEGGAQ